MSIEFLAKVLPWPGADEPGYINLHWMEKGRQGMSGRPVNSPNHLYEQRHWFSQDNKPRDFYICLSRQSEFEQKTSKAGKPYRNAVRRHENVLALKSLFVDLDCKHYESPTAALKDFQRVTAEAGLPWPNAIVSSGGGFHFYWAMSEAVPLDVWQPMANALAEVIRRHGLTGADTQCTVDAARVLRLPPTQNYKYDPPRKVEVKHLDSENFLPTDLAGKLVSYMVAIPATTQSFGGLKPTGVQVANNLAAGIEAPNYSVSMADLVNECPLLRDALTTGGQAYHQPLWNMTTFLATSLEDGRSMAHLMSRKHPGYSQESTDALYDRKEQERSQRNMGWPTCKAFSDAGSKLCKACPHFAEGKSPLNFAHKNGKVVSKTIKTLPMPFGYVHKDGIVYKQAYDKDGKDLGEVAIYHHQITDADIPPAVQPYLELFVPAVSRMPIKLPFETVGFNEIRATLASQNLVISNAQAKDMTTFMPSFIQALQNSKKDAVESTATSGWNMEDGEDTGFVYDGVVYEPNGTRQAALLDNVLRKQYSVSGSEKFWRKISETIIAQGHMGLNTIIASGFAGPLVKPSGQQGLILSAYSSESGLGKSTARSIGQSIFGDPTTGSSSFDDTANSTVESLSALPSFTRYFDEAQLVDTASVFKFVAGRGKARLNNSILQRPVGKWNTLIVVLSNEGIVHKTDRIPALMRILEFPVLKTTIEDEGAFIEVTDLTAQLDNNHGHAGRIYAEFLGKNHERVKEEVNSLHHDLQKELAATKDERFWLSIISTITLGAYYANELKLTEFDVNGIRNYLVQSFRGMRTIRTSDAIDVNDKESMFALLVRYTKARGRNTIKTDYYHDKSRMQKVHVINTESIKYGDMLHVQICIEDKVIRFSLQDFKRFCEDERLPASTVCVNAFTKLLNASVIKNTRIGSGTPNAPLQETICHVDLSGWATDIFKED